MQRQKLADALQKRDEMEARMKEIIAYLTQPGPDGKEPVGLRGNLLDENGFPRDDIDLWKVGVIRHGII
ncbi:uncharacterized protein [Blastocystis hominis]|uniref:Nas2 N-terminal domain-containing protein n=1 Tax=Blastocystis hominis TaxID=12968 RepID=D8M212_BLAHO|nr:uncharacterized protein [Blastocystis hominis]CBK22101.2 unnamed protein product [Blastocystis hominis]|eukprot:XP_012896149.1 uncharacterized protein [Blastocystis hominis]